MSRYDPKFNISPEEQALTEQLEIKLAMEEAKLARLKKETAPLLAASQPYVRYKDLRPPRPEERERFYVRYRAIVEELEAEAKQEQYDWYMSMVDFAP